MKKWLILSLLFISITGAIVTSAQTGETTPEPVVPTPVPMVIDPLLGVSIQPPLELTLPEGWELVLRDTFTYQDLVPDGDGQLETLPIDVYQGPLTNADGWIVMLWGYDSLVPYDPDMTEEEYYTRASWLDGLRMLQFVVFDARCNIGTSPQRDYEVGGFAAIGTTFSAVDCPFEQPDTRGWFAALSAGNLNFSFVAYADPIQPAGSVVEFELQEILDTVVFDIESITVTAQEFEATRQAVLTTPRAPLDFPDLTPQATSTP